MVQSGRHPHGAIRLVARVQGHLALRRELDEVAVDREHPGRIDLLLTDVIMPRMSGPDLAKRLRAERPGLPVLFVSGYPDQRLDGWEGEAAILPKPTSRSTLLAKVRELLGEEAPPAKRPPT